LAEVSSGLGGAEVAMEDVMAEAEKGWGTVGDEAEVRAEALAEARAEAWVAAKAEVWVAARAAVLEEARTAA